MVTRVCGMVLLCGASAQACTVPVFRYALDHWRPDAYRLEVPDGWEESAGGQSLRKLLAARETQVEVVPREDGEASVRLLMPAGQEGVVWSGELGEDASALFASAARDEVARRILAGESMVWVMVPSGVAQKDKAFEERLRSRLEYLGQVAAIPEQDPNDPESRLGPGPELRVGFSLLRLDREDPQERVFLRMLAGPGGAGKALLDGEDPFAAVVFGRGRVLGAWSAADLDEEGIDEVSLFLLGACSCRVKFQNPGWDLAMAVDWETRLMAAQMAADRDLDAGSGAGEVEQVEAAAPVATKLEVVKFESGREPDSEGGTKAGGFSVLWAGILAAIVGIGVAIAVGARKGH